MINNLPQNWVHKSLCTPSEMSTSNLTLPTELRTRRGAVTMLNANIINDIYFVWDILIVILFVSNCDASLKKHHGFLAQGFDLRYILWKLKNSQSCTKNCSLWEFHDSSLSLNTENKINRPDKGGLVVYQYDKCAVISSNKTEREQGSLLIDCTDSQLLFLLLKKQAENR